MVYAPARAQAPDASTDSISAARIPQRPVYKYALAPKPQALTPWIAPNRPHWTLAEILKSHDGQKSWVQPLVRDKDYVADYIQMAPGEVSMTRLYAQTSMFWIVEAGQMLVFIEGQEPFVASKGFVVWVPYRTPFHMETVGDAPSLRFEVTHAGAPPLYAVGEEPPTLKGQKYIKVAYTGAPGSYGAATRPYVDFSTEIIAQGGNNLRFLADGNFIRAEGMPMPPDSDQGHFHTDHNEFWFMMEGQTNFMIEGLAPFTAGQGDVVYAPQGRFHRPTPVGTGMSTRLSVAPKVNMAALDPDNPGR
jgi:mannose-6-phosphate isomerase-like protein (cupin superfamily)